MGQHGQRDVPIPALPVAHFVVVPPAFAFSCLKGLLDQPALSSHSDQRCKRVFPGGSVTEIVGVLGLFFDTASHEQPSAPSPAAPTAGSSSSHTSARPCCRNRRKGTSMRARANSA